MKQPPGRYFVSDDEYAPNKSSLPKGGNGVTFGAAGESESFNDLNEARFYAKSLWESAGRHHRIVIEDRADGDRVVQAFEPEPHDTRPDNSAEETQRITPVKTLV